MSQPHLPGTRPPPGSPPSGWTTGGGILALVLGVIICCCGGCIAASPYGLFLVGGGGNTDAFEEFARGPLGVGLIVAALAVVPIALGIWLLLRRR